MPTDQQSTKVWWLTALSLLAFAANSVLCRLALKGALIDAASFTAIRLFSGALVLALLVRFNRRDHNAPRAGSWLAGLMLFIYAAAFSAAYLSLDTGTGALVLFGAVQLTMVLVGLLKGRRLAALEWLGLLIAFSGLVYLVSPGVSAPPLAGFLLMSSAGMAWGFYTLIGRGSRFPLRDTASNFLRATPMVALLFVIAASLAAHQLHVSVPGIALAVASGALASGLGYALWYRALAGLAATEAAVVQLLVPVLAAAGGVVFAADTLPARLLVAAALTLGGIALVIMQSRRHTASLKS